MKIATDKRCCDDLTIMDWSGFYNLVIFYYLAEKRKNGLELCAEAKVFSDLFFSASSLFILYVVVKLLVYFDERVN